MSYYIGISPNTFNLNHSHNVKRKHAKTKPALAAELAIVKVLWNNLI